VQTKSGKLQGYFFDKTYVFKGIPYAQAKRFHMPEDATPWEGVREAASYGFVSPMLNRDNPSGELLVPHRYWPQDENCQNLNVWTNALDASAKKPVLVWLHGGGYAAGSSIEQVAYDGANMCHYGDAVVVSVNHRLNILGFLDLSPFGEQYAHSANAGLADLVAALKWVRDNIAAFGGDAGNVTIFGQSGGGMKCTGLMQIPAADGLFHKAIIMSGVSDGKLMKRPTGDGRMIVEALMKELGIPSDEVEKLEEVDYYDLARAYKKVSPEVAKRGGYIGGNPLPDDYYLGEPLLEGFTEHAKTIPFMVGSVFGEFAFRRFPYDKNSMTEAEMLAALTDKYGARAGELADCFRKAYPGKKVIELLALDRVFRAPSKELAALAANEGKAPAYLYNFTLEFPYQGGKVAWHCSDIPYFFHNSDKVEVCNIPGISDILEKQIFESVMSFARNGSPEHGGIPAWPSVTPADEPTMVFDRECEVRHNYDGRLLALFDEIAGPFSLAEMFTKEAQH
jgi:para-nitrobenzyl esterase